MFRSLLTAAIGVAVVAGFAVADEKKPDEKKAEKPVLKGTWTKETNGIVVDVKFGKEGEVSFIATAGDNGVTVNCKYTVEKDGTIKAKVTGTEEKGSFPMKPKDGAEFSFKLKIDGKTAKLTDFESKDLEGAKDAVEGEYASKEK